MSDELRPCCPHCGSGLLPVDGEAFQCSFWQCGNVNVMPLSFWSRRPIEDDLRAKLAVAVEALEKVFQHGCGILCEEADGDHHRLCPQKTAKEALAKIRS